MSALNTFASSLSDSDSDDDSDEERPLTIGLGVAAERNARKRGHTEDGSDEPQTKINKNYQDIVANSDSDEERPLTIGLGVAAERNARKRGHTKDGSDEPQTKINKNDQDIVANSDSDDDSDEERSLTIGLGVAAERNGRKRGHTEDGGDESQTKKMKPDTPEPSGIYNKFAQNMMAKMGHKKGTGLGKHSQGRLEIVEASNQRGRRGLGLQVKGFEMAKVEWNFEEEVLIDKSLTWLPSCKLPIPDLDELESWLKVGDKKRIIDDETLFCTEEMLTSILKGKTIFDNLEPEEMRRARTRSNPYETIRGAFFQNRAAVKMANMDADLDFMFTQPKDNSGRSLIDHGELLYFADVCAGPGGFSEYVLWRRKGDAKGFGMTLKGACDFKLEEFFAGPSEMFEPHYGVGGLDGDGDVFKPENQEEFRKFVMENTNNKGIHFGMADGGFSVEGQENIQEILSKQLYLCQMLVILSVLREGGHFVCKLFDLFTPFSIGLVYLMYRIFEQVSIYKPVTSRPANSERYIICKHLRADPQPVQQYLRNVNDLLNKHSSSLSSEDVNEIVSMTTLQTDDDFYTYMFESNEDMGKAQILNLLKIKAFTQNPELYEARQVDVRKDCLKRWQLPDEVRTAPSKREPKKKFAELIKDNPDSFEIPATSLSHQTLQAVKSIYDYRCIVSGSTKRVFLLGLGRSNVYSWDGQAFSGWQKLDIRLELPPDTLVEAEIVQELKGKDRGQKRITTVHLVDGCILCGTDIRQLHYNERLERLRKFAKAITKKTRSDLTPVTVPEAFRFEELGKIFERLSMKVVKGSAGQPRLCFDCGDSRYYHPTGIYFMRMVKDPWHMHFSKSNNRKYFYNSINGKSDFTCPQDSIASVSDCRKNTLYWAWETGVKVQDSQQNKDDSKVSKEHIMNFINTHSR